MELRDGVRVSVVSVRGARDRGFDTETDETGVEGVVVGDRSGETGLVLGVGGCGRARGCKECVSGVERSG